MKNIVHDNSAPGSFEEMSLWGKPVLRVRPIKANEFNSLKKLKILSEEQGWPYLLLTKKAWVKAEEMMHKRGGGWVDRPAAAKRNSLNQRLENRLNLGTATRAVMVHTINAKSADSII